MCGIAGIVSLEGFDPQALVHMTHLVAHRGPNGFGFAYIKPGQAEPCELIHNQDLAPRMQNPVVGLGSRRLAILDVSSRGDMPMQTADGALCIVYNGEIYNYREIRKDLEARGSRFTTDTDTEVILAAYQLWGEDCVLRFNGMWSFAIWDRSSQKLFCSRDRFGVKPFYYTSTPGTFIFGSEIKQILSAAKMSRIANSRTVVDFLEWGLLDHSSETFFQGIHQLPASHSLRVRLRFPLAPLTRRYWELRVASEHRLSVEDATNEFRARFTKAVSIRLRSDVPVGVCLSGGLDSSSILCKAKEVAPDVQFRTFSACFRQRVFDERKFISAAVSSVGGLAHSVFPEAHSFWENLHSIIYHHDEPVGGPSVFAQWSVMADARRHQTPVVLGGQGGDETLCGYQKYRYFYLWDLLRRGDPCLLRELMMWARNGTQSYWTLSSATRYLPGILHAPFSLTQRVCNRGTQEIARKESRPLGPSSSIAERQKTDLLFSSIPTLLRHEDRNSMAHSIESRLPFLDYELAEFAVNCPASLKLRDGWSKWILRNAMVNTLPEEIRLRKTKLGFDTPESEWLRSGLQNGQRGLWDTPRLKMDRFLDSRALARECRRFLRQSPGALRPACLFRALSLELWSHVHAVS